MASIEGLVDKDYENKSSAELMAAPLSAISGVSEEDARRIKEAFGVETVGAFAHHPVIKAILQIRDWAKSSKPAETTKPVETTESAETTEPAEKKE